MVDIWAELFKMFLLYADKIVWYTGVLHDCLTDVSI